MVDPNAYDEEEINAAIARVEIAKQNDPVGWRFLREVNLSADEIVVYAFANADAHVRRLGEEDRRVIYAAGWLQGLAVGVALGESRSAR